MKEKTKHKLWSRKDRCPARVIVSADAKWGWRVYLVTVVFHRGLRGGIPYWFRIIDYHTG